jgi:hypothetical protein
LYVQGLPFPEVGITPTVFGAAVVNNQDMEGLPSFIATPEVAFAGSSLTFRKSDGAFLQIEEVADTRSINFGFAYRAA